MCRRHRHSCGQAGLGDVSLAGREPKPRHERGQCFIADGLDALPLGRRTDPLYVAYHDEEWGVPEWDDRALYEKLMLDGFQAGLSWITILRKRDNFRRAFDDFDPEKIARYTPKKVERLMQDAGIVRNRAKIEGAVEFGARLSQDHGERPGIFRHAVGSSRRQAEGQQIPRAASRSRPRPTSRARCRRN